MMEGSSPALEVNVKELILLILFWSVLRTHLLRVPSVLSLIIWKFYREEGEDTD